MADEEDEKGSGDVGSEQKSEPEPEPPKVPDVELIVDGFGFMPKSMQQPKSRSSNVFEKSSKSLKEILTPEPEGKSPCASSTNIDIVRRYTWRTKNRMTVQVNPSFGLYKSQDFFISGFQKE